MKLVCYHGLLRRIITHSNIRSELKSKHIQGGAGLSVEVSNNMLLALKAGGVSNGIVSAFIIHLKPINGNVALLELLALM